MLHASAKDRQGLFALVRQPYVVHHSPFTEDATFQNGSGRFLVTVLSAAAWIQTG
jgi:hypothetical protein